MRRRAGAWGLLAIVLLSPAAAIEKMGANAGIRVLLHVDLATDVDEGELTDDPCLSLPPVTRVEEFTVDYDGEADTVWVWVYLHHPGDLAVKAFGFAIDYEGVDVVTSGSCGRMVYQNEETMGKWADPGAEIAFSWTEEQYPNGKLAPVAWFLLNRTERNGYFAIRPGKTPMGNGVADTSKPTIQDAFWATGKIGFGDVPGELPIVLPGEVPGSHGAVGVGIR